jgi:hypothetical protein
LNPCTWSHRVWPLTVLILALAGLLCLPGSGTQAQQTPDLQKVILEGDDPAARQALLDRGGRLIVDYGAFSLWLVPDQKGMAVAEAHPDVSVHPELDLLLLREATLDTRTLASAGVSMAESGSQLTLVQFVGPVRDEWLADLEATGAQIVAYVPYNGYLVWADEEARAQIANRVTERLEYQWQGPYRPAYRLAGSLHAMAGSGSSDVAVQVVRHSGSKQTVDEILARSEALLRDPYALQGTVVLTIRVPAAMLAALAARPDVLNVEPWQPPNLLDERQGQILAGNLTPDGIQPAGPGYLAWLDGLGFSKDPADYPIVDVIDDGFDRGLASNPWQADFYRLGSYANASRVVYARDMTPDGNPHNVSGHGTLNLAIVGGYNNTQGSSLYEDAAGYQYGLGISPYGRLASSKVFNDRGNWDYRGSMAGLIQGAYQNGARITSNSWGSESIDSYTTEAQAFDALTRDADPAAFGNQEMAHVFAAGNEGSASTTIRSPGTAKNVITVGASENVRPTGTDGCGYPNAAANNLQDLATFSSRGPTADGRIKPDVVAPGTHVQGAVSQDPEYNASGVCNAYWPVGQDLYTWSTGTSHAAPAVAGALSLIYARLTRDMGGVPPSPAMLKASLLNGSRYLTGEGAGGSLPSNNQGWGLANLGMVFDSVPRMAVDQSVLLGQTGQVYERAGLIADPSRPFRVTLAWTDAPGTPAAAAWVNDLNLEVTVGGQTYKGNVFAGSASIPGGATDSRNNVESVFLPAGTAGPFTVRVVAYTLAGDGVPGNQDGSDQDFALVLYNALAQPDFAVGIAPAGAQVCRGQEITYTVHVTGLFGYAGTVNLAHNPPPPNVGVTLSPLSGVPSFDASMRVSTQAAADAGLYTWVVTGTGDRTHVATATLAVDAAAPAAAALISPTNSITNVVLRPALAWETAPQARSYRLQVARDDAFAQILIDRTLQDISFTPPSDLDRDTTYYWRVTAQNGCGESTSPTWTFTTVNVGNTFYDDVENGAAKWTVETTTGNAKWEIASGWSHSGSYAWYMVSYPAITDARLTTARAIPLYETSTLTFWHWYDMESTDQTAWDGGVLEISVDGGVWQDLGPYITENGYTHQVSEGYGNPLGGRPAWSGPSDGWRRVTVDLSAFAGSSAHLRFRWGGDNSNMGAYTGWYVDDIQVTTIWPPSRFKIYLNVAAQKG